MEAKIDKSGVRGDGNTAQLMFVTDIHAALMVFAGMAAAARFVRRLTGVLKPSSSVCAFRNADNEKESISDA